MFKEIEKEIEEFMFNDKSDDQIENGLASIDNMILMAEDDESINSQEADYLACEVSQLMAIYEELA